MIPIIGDPAGYAAARLGLRSDVQFIKSSSEWWFEHGFDNAYKGALKQDADDFKKAYVK